MNQQSSDMRAAGSSSPSAHSADSSPSQISPRNTGQGSVPQVTYPLDTARSIPESRPARLILPPHDFASAENASGMASQHSPQADFMHYYSAQRHQQHYQGVPLYDSSDNTLPIKKKALFSAPSSSGASNTHETGLGIPYSSGAWRGTKPVTTTPTKISLPQNAYPLPQPLLENKLPREQLFLESYNQTDHAGAVATCRLERVPLPMLEKVPGGPTPCRMRVDGPLVRVRLPHLPEVDGDIKRFCQRVMMAISGAADDCRRLVSPCTELRLPKLNCYAPQPTAIQECKECGYKGHYCPECGSGQKAGDIPLVGAAYARIQPSRGILVPQEGYLERCMRWHWSLFEEVGSAIDQEILCDRTGGLFREFGEFVDNLVAEGIHAVSFGFAGLFSAIPGRSRTIVEGYPMYEPEPKFIRKERPTSATGSACVDHVNAFLDACLTNPSSFPLELQPPPVPDTQKTGNWLIDSANAALDYCLQDRTPPPLPPLKKKICPIEMLIPPCCRERPSVPPPSPKQRPKEDVGGCQIQLCPMQEPEIAVFPTGPALVYPYTEDAFDVRDKSGLVEVLDDSADGTPCRHITVLSEPVKNY
ncbi:hypothetical protein cyc_05769 [Cyclospora cayetanensis]|uniref:Uncharacterized protein n=1 Tax=Cyclospora cayetanensis TaxID=88456 RepID=A0A1D3D123_9EIME|nr:hypothetical protein cyc_05769 [Cyclospora cayetanensis]